MTCGEITARMAIPVLPQSGGTGVRNNPASTLTISGKFPTTLTVTGTTNVTLPTSGTLVNTAVTTLSSLVSVGTITTGSWNASGFVRVNGATTVGIDCLANTNSANIGATCTSNTSGHHARLYAEMDGNNSGQDPFANFKNTNAGTDWAIGSDTSDSGKFKISAGATLGSTDVMTMATSGFTTFVGGDVRVNKSVSGNGLNLLVQNQATAAGSHSVISASVVNGSSGSPYIVFDISGVNDWAIGSNNGDSQAFVISSSAALGTSNIMRASTAGVINYPLQPVFNAWKTGGAGNITGDGTVSSVLVDAQNQQGSCYTGNQTYTAKATGYHLLICSFQFTGLSASFTHGDIRITTTSETYIPFACNIGAVRDGSGTATFNGSCIAKMTAGDTAISQFMASGGTKVVGVGGAATAITEFMGYQLC